MHGKEKNKPEEQEEQKLDSEEKNEGKSTETAEEKPAENAEETSGTNSDENSEPEKKEDNSADEASDEHQAEENGEGADASSVESNSTENQPPKFESHSAESQPSEPNSPVTDSADCELLNVKAQLAAIKSGVRIDVVEDAICLAMNDAEKNGEITEESVAEALSGVLSRHPEWKNAPENTNNFRVGADGSKENHSSNEEISQIFGNK